MTVFGKITAKNQTTIPAEIRKALGLKPGDRVGYEMDEDGTVRIVRAPASGLADLAGMFEMPEGVTYEDVERALAERRGR